MPFPGDPRAVAASPGLGPCLIGGNLDDGPIAL